MSSCQPLRRRFKLFWAFGGSSLGGGRSPPLPPGRHRCGHPDTWWPSASRCQGRGTEVGQNCLGEEILGRHARCTTPPPPVGLIAKATQKDCFANLDHFFPGIKRDICSWGGAPFPSGRRGRWGGDRATLGSPQCQRILEGWGGKGVVDAEEEAMAVGNVSNGRGHGFI